ncbi:PAS domain S-box protein [Candidatus Laterigemmans baculatus]|uniref:PAS domain S-box protein n=1 Tax=Candidatus Laterigemmans baculatus TaxID=2770505 RepID=UPI0013DA7102|nr:PAS domain S-box protein [Candidatus Laterigemmans baculatus]
MNEAEPDDLLQVTLASIGDAVIATDPEGRVTFLNAVAENLTGWPTEEAQGRPLHTVFRIFNEHTREPVENPVEKVLRLGRTVGLANHTILVARDGTEVPIDDSAAPIRGGDGRLRGVVLVFRDITERKQAEDAAAERHRITALRADLATALAQPRSLQAGLQACCKTFGRHLEPAVAGIWVRDEAEGLLELWASGGAADHLADLQAPLRFGEGRIGRIAAAGEPELINEPSHESGESGESGESLGQWGAAVGFAGIPLVVDGRVFGVLAIFSGEPLGERLLEDLIPLAEQVAQHIERKRAEERLRESELRYRLIGQVANDAIWDWDLVTNRVVWNEGVQARFGYRPEQIGSDASWWVDHIHEADRERVVHSIHGVIDDGEFWEDEYRFCRADGSYAMVFDRGRVVRDESGKPIRMVGSMLDLTERLQAEERLREREERLRMAIESASIGTWDFDPATGSLKWSDRCKAMFGLPPQAEVTYEVFSERLHPEDRERVHRGVEEALSPEGDGRYELDYRSLWPDGTVRWIVAKGQGLFESDGQERRAVRFIGTVLDVTERKRGEESLRFQLDLTRSITDNATTAIFMMDDRSRCTFMNPAAEAMTGFTFAEVGGGVLHDFIHHHRPDGTPYPMSECPIDRALPEHFEVRSHEDVFFRKNGEAFPVMCNARVIYKKGTAIGTVIEVRETTAERKAAEAALKRSEQLRRLADVATRIGLAHDVASVMGIVTEEIRHIVESHQSVASMTVDQDWAQAITAVSMSEKYDRWKHYDKPPDGSGIYSLVCRMNGPMRLTQAELEAHPAWKRFCGDEDHPPMRGWLAAPLVGRDGRNIGLLQVSDKLEGEFTEDDEAVLVQLAQMASVAVENARLVESLRHADRRKDEFLATLAHELRNPLAPIRMGLEVMKLSGDVAGATEEVRGMMERQTEQLITLVDDLLDVSRITQGKLELRKCRVSIADVVQNAVEASRPQVDGAGHELTVKVPDDPIHLEADPNRLTQVISNLLNNAAKYTPEGGQIGVSVKRQGSDVVVLVRDNGIGIPAEMQQRVFEMFAQIDRPMEKGYVGLGIGLTLVKRLVEMHGGVVEARSEGTDKGSEFSVRLPVLMRSPAEERRPESPQPEAVKVSRRVLVVDDNKAAADMLALVVKMLGNEVRTASDGQQAVAIAAEYLPEVVLMDLGMPKMNGYEAARHIRQQDWGATMLLVALTGWGQEEDRQRTKAAGFDHHLVKPAEPADLQQLFARIAPNSA